MKKVILIYLLLFVSVSSGQLMTSIQPKYQHDISNTGFIPTNGIANGTIRWTINVGQPIINSVVIDNSGNYYIGTNNGRLYSIYQNGTEKWNVSLGAPIQSTALLDYDGNVYIGINVVGATPGRFFSINETGGIRWTYTPAGSGGSFLGSPTIDDDGIVYVNRDLRFLYAFFSGNGTAKWSYPLAGVSYGSPAHDNVNVYLAYGAAMLAVDKNNGTLAWERSTAEQVSDWGPVLYGGDVFYITKTSGIVYSCIASDGTPNWNYSTGRSSGPLAYYNNHLYYGSNDGNITVLNLDGTLDKKIKLPTSAFLQTPPVLTPNGDIYLGTDDGKLWVVNVPTGTVRWNYSFASSYIWGAPSVDTNGFVYIGVSNGNLTSFGPQGVFYKPSGYVYDGFGLPIYGVNVTIGNKSTKSNPLGFYNIVGLADGTYSYSVVHNFYTSQTGTINISNSVGSLKNFTLSAKCIGICDKYVAKNGSDSNTGLNWSDSFLTISYGVNNTLDFGTLHIGYGNYSNQTTIDGNRSLEFFCDSSGFKENVSEPWCDMPLVNTS